MVKEVHAAHILVKTQEEAQSIVSELAQGKATFAKLAQERSMCPSGKRGGDLGWFSRGKMAKEFENAAFSMRKGEMSEPIKTPFGWHVIRLLENR